MPDKFVGIDDPDPERDGDGSEQHTLIEVGAFAIEQSKEKRRQFASKSRLSIAAAVVGLVPGGVLLFLAMGKSGTAAEWWNYTGFAFGFMLNALFSERFNSWF